MFMKKYLKSMLSIMLSIGIVVGSFAVAASTEKETVHAAAANANKSLVFGYDHLMTNINSSKGATVYFGYYKNQPISWKVIKKQTARGGDTILTFLSTSAVGPNTAYRKSTGSGNSYEGSDLKSEIESIYYSGINAQEKEIMTSKRILPASYVNVSPYSDGVAGTMITDRLRPLSLSEVYALDPALRKIGVDYWLRTPGKTSTDIQYVTSAGDYDVVGDSVTQVKGVRPSFMCRPKTILFTTANGVKSNDPSSVGKMVKIQDYTKNEWKLTLYCKDYDNFIAFIDKENYESGENVKISFLNGLVGSRLLPGFVSVIITDMNDSPIYYGHIAHDKEYGAVNFQVPSDLLTGKYKVKVFSELCNGDKRTDCATNIEEFTISVKCPATVKTIKAESVDIHSVRLTWEPVAGAEGYLIYARKKGVYGYVGMTTQGTTYLDTNALATENNFYWVFAFVRNKNGKMITGGCENYVFERGRPVPVTGLRARSGEARVILTWDAMEGAEGYMIYAKRPGEEYKYVRTVTGTTWTDVFLCKDDYTYYWVFWFYKLDGVYVTSSAGKYVYANSLPI